MCAPFIFRGQSFCAEFWSTRSTTRRAAELTAPVRITHPFHPQCGQEIAVVERRKNWGEDRLFYRDRQGHLASLPSRWTSVEAEDPFVAAATGRSRLRAGDLVALAALVRELRS
jgi:hypothetical protein